jgi:hypothetical protein
MQFEEIITSLIGRLTRRLVRRGIAMAVFALFVLVALYHLTIAGTVALETLYGPLYARLIVVGAYVMLAVVAFAYLFATRAKPVAKARPNVSRATKDVQLAMLLESILVGYTTGRSKSR